MFSTEPYCSPSRPPIVLVMKREPFVCSICLKPGIGPPNARVHPGKCHTEHVRRRAKKQSLRRKAIKVAQAQQIEGPNLTERRDLQAVETSLEPSTNGPLNSLLEALV